MFSRGKEYINIGKKNWELLLHMDDVPTRKMNKLFDNRLQPRDLSEWL